MPDDARIGYAKVADNGRATVDGLAPGLFPVYADRVGSLLGATIGAGFAVCGEEFVGKIPA